MQSQKDETSISIKYSPKKLVWCGSFVTKASTRYINPRKKCIWDCEKHSSPENIIAKPSTYNHKNRRAWLRDKTKQSWTNSNINKHQAKNKNKYCIIKSEYYNNQPPRHECSILVKYQPAYHTIPYLLLDTSCVSFLLANCQYNDVE